MQANILCMLLIGSACLGPASLACAAAPEKQDKPVSADAVRFFESRIRPVLAENCFRCHGPDKQKDGLRLDSLACMKTGGKQGTVLVPGKAAESLLIQAVNHTGGLKMPPKGKLTREQIADLARWVTMGAPWPAGAAPARPAEFRISDQARAHWAFQPVKRPAVPTVKNQAWVANPIDAFILARLEMKGLAPNSPANRRQLIRRLSYDLTGLPPSPAEVEAFVQDRAADAWRKRIDQLLASPRHGEQWGRHWLDLVRFAETNSYERDGPKPHAWRYRDYVIRSFNEDKPYDQFIREQLAGDELKGQGPDALIATGYYRLGIWDDEPTDPLQARYDGLDDIVATTGQVFLGLTLDCARCHDHKLDPISQKDYYRFLAFFHNINHYRNGGPTDLQPIFASAQARKDHEDKVRALREKRAEATRKMAVIEKAFQELLARDQQAGTARRPPAALPRRIADHGERLLGKERFALYQKLQASLTALDKQQAPADQALCITEAGNKAPDTFVLQRGNPHVKGDKVEPGFPEIFNANLPDIPRPPGHARTTGRRLALASWIASPANPLTARVIANRVWQYHFGRGLVRSSNNFGLHGDQPTHRELLDWLAAELVNPSDPQARPWSLKHLHRLILTSSTYQMSAQGNPKALAVDSANDLFWRVDMRRLTGEEIRDSILAVSGDLNLKMHGPGVYPEMPREVLAGQSMPGSGWGKSPREEQNRRSIYAHVKRSLLVPILESFDAADADRSNPSRFATTQPTQALLMLNNKFLNQQAGRLAARLRKQAGPDPDQQVALALQLATGRPASSAEIKRGADLMKLLQKKDGASREAALTHFCLLVFNLNEFVYLD